MITVSPAEPADAAGIADLLAELSQFYGAAVTESRPIRVRQVGEALFGTPPAAHALVARDDRVVAGLAAYSFVWPAAGLSRSLYLKELFVAGAFRGHGTGKLLMQAVLDTAARLECSRVEWTTDTDNAPARAFYAELDLPVHPGKIFYRVERPALAGREPGSEGRHCNSAFVLRSDGKILPVQPLLK